MNKLELIDTRLKKIIIFLMILIPLALLESCSSSKIRDDIYGGFEDTYDGENPDGWFANDLPQTKKNAELSVDNSVAHTGDQSIFISIFSNHPPENTLYNWIRRVDGLKEGGIYELQGWIKTEGIKNSPFIDVQCWNNIKLIGSASTSQNYSITGTKNWQHVKTIFSLPKGTSKILIRAGITSSGNNGGKVWFDDFKITKVK
ncbi:MAG: hypothetical protein FIA82_02240 [Melioribacter sp.]|nr:hypothetical protein [Melioribacter sp.]